LGLCFNIDLCSALKFQFSINHFNKESAAEFKQALLATLLRLKPIMTK
jgi:hypothetical protein